MLTNIKTTGYGYKWFFLIPMALLGMAIFYLIKKAQYQGLATPDPSKALKQLETPNTEEISRFMDAIDLDTSRDLIELVDHANKGAISIKDTNPSLGYNVEVLAHLISKLMLLEGNYPSVKDHDDKAKAIGDLRAKLGSIPPNQASYNNSNPPLSLADLQFLYRNTWLALLIAKYGYMQLHSLADPKELIYIESKIKIMQSSTNIAEVYAIGTHLQERFRNALALELELANDELQKHYLDNQTEIQRINRMPIGSSQEIQDRLNALGALYPPNGNIEEDKKQVFYPITFLIQHIKDLKFSAQSPPIEAEYIKLVFNIIRILQMEYRGRAITEVGRTDSRINTVKFSSENQDIADSNIQFSADKGFSVCDGQASTLTRMLSVIYEIDSRMKTGERLLKALEAICVSYNSDVDNRLGGKDTFKNVRSIITMDDPGSPPAANYVCYADLLRAMLNSTDLRIRAHDSPKLSNASGSSFLGGGGPDHLVHSTSRA